MKFNFFSILVLAGLLISTPVLSQEKDINFDAKYVKNNNQKVTVEINEVQELIYIIIAITENGKGNPTLVNQKTDYYTEVATYFSPYSNHEVIQKFNALLTENMAHYFILAGNAYGFKFDQDKIVPTGIYNFLVRGVGSLEATVNPIDTYLKDLEDFANKSGYRAFYKSHNQYYTDLKIEYSNYASIDAQKKWLESKFDYKIDSYRVLTSPLIGGMNATKMYEDNNFKEILLFLPTIRDDKEWSPKFKKVINTRIIFTEIDHNYVRPVSEKNEDNIKAVFDNRDKWVNSENKSTAHYPDAISVFDEYLTWGLFTLYSYDTFSGDKDLFNQIIENVNDMMVNKKGFTKAKEFNSYLLELYKNNKEKKIDALYPLLLEWSTKQ